MSLKQTITERLSKAGVTPSKGLGQNFLIEAGAYKKIIEAGDIKKGELIIEVGPGAGTLTEELIREEAQVIAIEKDHKLADFLKKHFGDQAEIIENDILKFNPVDSNLKDDSYKIIANIPYYITSHFLRTVFETWPKPALIVVLIQKEVAQRIIAKPPHTNLLALSVQYFSSPQIISYVKKGSFYPVPTIDSAILKLETKNIEYRPKEEAKKLFKIIKMGFSSKRKQLINNLSSGLKLTKDKIGEILLQAEIDIKVRPENLSLDQWKKISDIIYQQ